MVDSIGYAQLLRPIGQMLEALRIESFSVVADGEEFVVRDKTSGRKQLTPREKALLADLQEKHNRPADKSGALKMASGILEWRLTREDIDRLEQEGRGRRREGNLTPDGYAVAQMLRVVGTLVDQNRGRLLKIDKDKDLIVLEYEAPPNRKVREELTLPMMYDAWVRIYKRRGG